MSEENLHNLEADKDFLGHKNTNHTKNINKISSKVRTSLKDNIRRMNKESTI